MEVSSGRLFLGVSRLCSTGGLHGVMVMIKGGDEIQRNWSSLTSQLITSTKS
jgi:hypothetical protein